MKTEQFNPHFTYPSSRKVYRKGVLFPELRVGMREVTLTRLSRWSMARSSASRIRP